MKTIGNAFLIEFASPLEAVRCAIAIQAMLHSESFNLKSE